MYSLPYTPTLWVAIGESYTEKLKTQMYVSVRSSYIRSSYTYLAETVGDEGGINLHQLKSHAAAEHAALNL